MDLKYGGDACLEIVGFWLFRIVDLYGEPSTRDVENGCVVEEDGELVGVDGCTGDYYLEVSTGGENVF